MIHYIYFVKCQDCEDEHFDFFADAKAHAVSCLDLHPIITQVEVDRNDFGECVASKDLGTVWSWEEVMNDAEVTDETTFSKADTLGVDIDNDPEFLAIDNSLEDVAVKCKKPLSEMSIKDLVEAMEENEDQVECVGCEELYDKTDCERLENHGWICPDCQDTVVECSWCKELFDKSECREEVDLGYLCGRCESAIKSRGETLTFREDVNTGSGKVNLEPADPDCEVEAETLHTDLAHDQLQDAALEEAVAPEALTQEVKDEMMTVVAMSFETGHWSFEGFHDFEREYSNLEDPKAAWEYYNELINLGPAGFYEEFADQYDFDPMFVAEYGGSVEESFEHISDFKDNLQVCPECGKNTFDSETEICLECGSGPLSEDFLRNK